MDVWLVNAICNCFMILILLILVFAIGAFLVWSFMCIFVFIKDVLGGVDDEEIC